MIFWAEYLKWMLQWKGEVNNNNNNVVINDNNVSNSYLLVLLLNLCDPTDFFFCFHDLARAWVEYFSGIRYFHRNVTRKIAKFVHFYGFKFAAPIVVVVQQ